MEKEQKLVSVKLQRVMDMNTLNIELWCPVLSFGRKKTDKFRLPILFNNYEQASKMYNDINELIGNGIYFIKEESAKLLVKYKKYNVINK